MRLFTRPQRAEERAFVPFMGGDWPMNTHSGQVVTPESSLRSAAVWACQRVLTSVICSLPVDVYRVTGGKRQPVEGAALPQLVRQPSLGISRRAWLGQVVRSQLSSGNAYGWVRESDALERPTRIDTVNPSFVSWLDVKGRLTPHVNGKAHELFPRGDFWHLPVSWLLPAGSLVAMSPTEYGREAIGAGLAAEEFGSRFFGDGAYQVPIVTSDKELNDQQADLTKRKLLTAMRGGSRQPIVWSKGLTIDWGKQDPSANQFIDLLRFEVEQACRLYGVPPSMVYASVSGQNVTYANVTQSDLHFLKYSVGVWLQDLEDFFTAAIPAPQIVKFNADAVLRMDAKARAELHEIRLRTGTRTPNEVRRLEDEDPFDDPKYDEPGVPGGMPPVAPTGAAADPSPPDGGAP